MIDKYLEGLEVDMGLPTVSAGTEDSKINWGSVGQSAATGLVAGAGAMLVVPVINALLDGYDSLVGGPVGIKSGSLLSNNVIDLSCIVTNDLSGNTVKAVRGGEAVLRYTLAGLEDTYAECRIIVETSIKRGDVDGSGNVDIADLRMVLRAVCKKITLTETQKQSADVTDDGSVGIEDLRKILRYVCRKIDEL